MFRAPLAHLLYTTDPACLPVSPSLQTAAAAAAVAADAVSDGLTDRYSGQTPTHLPPSTTRAVGAVSSLLTPVKCVAYTTGLSVL